VESATGVNDRQVGGGGRWSWLSDTGGGARAASEPVWSRAPEPVVGGHWSRWRRSADGGGRWRSTGGGGGRSAPTAGRGTRWWGGNVQVRWMGSDERGEMRAVMGGK
jgi:hypothetical protein